MVEPSLTHVAELVVTVAAPITVGRTATGLRRIVPITGGSLRGPKLSGTVLAAGADYQLIRDDGYTTLDARYVIQMNDGQNVYVVNNGVRFGPADVMDKITRGETVDPTLVYFRTVPRFETSSKAYHWLTMPLFVASGERHPDQVVMNIFEVR